MYLGIAGSYDCCCGTSLYELDLTFQILTSNCQQTLGGYLEARTLARTRSALKDMLALAPTEVTVFRNGTEINVAPHEVIPGETVVVRPDAAAALQALRKAGVKRLVMLTGDHAASAWRVARELGIDEVHAGLLPEQKLEAIKTIQRESGPTAMVGDGINDAPALAAADIGIAMGAAGTDVAIESADIALMADDLGKIPEAIGLARATLNNIRQNVVIALLTVIGLLAGVFANEGHMAGGMFIHQISVLVVVVNGMRLLRARPGACGPFRPLPSNPHRLFSGISAGEGKAFSGERNSPCQFLFAACP